MLSVAASFDEQLSPVAPFLFYVVIAGIIFIETGLLIGFFLPGDSLLFSAGLVAASRDDINIIFLILAVFLAAFVGDQVGYVIGRKVGRPYLEKHKSKRMQKMLTRCSYHQNYRQYVGAGSRCNCILCFRSTTKCKLYCAKCF